MPAHNHENIDVTVVVSGQPERLKVNVHQTLEHLVRDALQRSNNQGQAPSDWELRTEDGQLLDQSQMRRPMLSRLPFKRIAIGLSATCLAMVVLDAATGNMHAGTHHPIWVHGTSVVFGLCGWALVFLRMRDDTTFGLDPLPVTIL